jgi:arylsulfatase A-like enzyme
VNVLLVTIDQLRAEVLDNPVVDTPTLDRLAATGVAFARHYSQAAPCSPGRASLYTGTYQMNHRVVGNGTPLSDHLDNVGRLGRRAGFDPVLFGYTDQGLDPARASGPNDPRLDYYDGVLPGFSEGLHLPEDQAPWLAWLASLGYDVSGDALAEMRREPERPAEHSLSAFLTNGFLAWLDRQDAPWFAHLSYWRPHPPYAAAGEYATRYHLDEVGDGLAPAADRHPLHEIALSLPMCQAPATEGDRRQLRTQYYGMVSEVDAQLGRVLAALDASGQLADTLVVVTADHGEQLCDHGLIEKLGFFEESYRIPLVVAGPVAGLVPGTRVDAFTEAVDVLPTIASALGVEVPLQCDGMPLQDLVGGDVPAWWRTASHYEWDWRSMLMGPTISWPAERELERSNLCVVRSEDAAYVHFGDGTWLCFDLVADPTWRTTTSDAAVVLEHAQAMLTWRQEHLDRRLADMLLGPERLGRWPMAIS